MFRTLYPLMINLLKLNSIDLLILTKGARDVEFEPIKLQGS